VNTPMISRTPRPNRNLDSSDAILATYAFGYDLDNTTGNLECLAKD